MIVIRCARAASRSPSRLAGWVAAAATVSLVACSAPPEERAADREPAPAPAREAPAPPAGETPGGPATPEIVNVANLEDGARGPVLIHFTSDQWKQAMEGVDVREIPSSEPASGVLEAVRLPGPTGGVVVASTLCAEPCIPVWRSIEVEPGDPRGPGGSLGGLIPDCDCEGRVPEPPPEEQDPRLPPPTCARPEECRLAIRFEERGDLGSRWRILCETQQECDACALDVARTSEGRWVLCCVCGPL